MLRTPSNTTPQVEGINQQDFSELQMVRGVFPHQIGLQKRVPGKTLQQSLGFPIGSIYVFYLVLGRHYQLLDYGGGGIQIDEVNVPPIVLPGLPPTGNQWFDTFSGYEDGLISKLWGAGAWANSTGVCETIIDGKIDPFLVYATLPPSQENPPPPNRPKPLPPPATDPGIPNAPAGFPSLPTGTYTDYPLSAGFEDMQRQNITGLSEGLIHPLPCDVNSFTVGILGLTYGSEFAVGVMQATVSSQSFKGCNNLAWAAENYKISNSTGYKGSARIIINEMAINPRSQVFVIGVEQKSDASGGTVTTDVADDLTAYINTEGQRFNVIPPAGAVYHDPSPGAFGYERILQNGTLTWTGIRVYDPPPL